MEENKIKNENKVTLEGKWNSIFWGVYIVAIILCFVIAFLIGDLVTDDFSTKRIIASAGIFIGMGLKGLFKQIVYQWSQK